VTGGIDGDVGRAVSLGPPKQVEKATAGAADELEQKTKVETAKTRTSTCDLRSGRKSMRRRRHSSTCFR
jgi:hypothetical protein